MGRRWLQSASFSRALFIQLTKATFSSSENREVSVGKLIHTIDHNNENILVRFSDGRVSNAVEHYRDSIRDFRDGERRFTAWQMRGKVCISR